MKLDSKIAKYPLYKRKRVFTLIIDDSYIFVDNAFGFGFVLNQYKARGLEYTFPKREIFLLLNEIYSLIEKSGRHTVYTDGGKWYDEAYNVPR